MLTLWLYAIWIGVGSARAIARHFTATPHFAGSSATRRWGTRSCRSSALAISRRRQALYRRTRYAAARQGLSLELVAQDGHARARERRRRRRFGDAASLRTMSGTSGAAPRRRCARKRTIRRRARARSSTRLAAAHRLPASRRRALAAVKAPQDRGQGGAARIDDGCRGARDEDGRRRLSPRIQRADGHGRARRSAARAQSSASGDERRQRRGSVSPMLEQIEAHGQLPEVLGRCESRRPRLHPRRERGVEALIACLVVAKAGRHANHDESVMAWRAQMTTDEAKQPFAPAPRSASSPTPTSGTIRVSHRSCAGGWVRPPASPCSPGSPRTCSSTRRPARLNARNRAPLPERAKRAIWEGRAARGRAAPSTDQGVGSSSFCLRSGPSRFIYTPSVKYSRNRTKRR